MGNRRQILVWLLFPVFFSSCSHLFYYPDRTLYFLPAKLGFKAEEYRFRSGDGTELVGWFLPAASSAAKAPKGTLVLFHGNAENISSHFLTLAWLTREGYGLFVFDYRGYGKSEDKKPDQKGTVLDGVAGLEFAFDLHQKSGAQRFVVVGQSLGGAIAMRSLENFSKKDAVDLVVLDSTFASYKDVARRILASHWATWLFSPLGMLLVSDAYSAEESVRAWPRKLLVIHDRHDKAVPFGAGEELFENAGTKQKDFWVLDQGRHIGVFMNDNTEWRARFVQTLDQLR